ncbi:venom protease-like [Ischnura elegans]|uniref:venom protease-like n=1 Tax=Ischnura elegans TaxID=197161 RepID=UPI001ED89B5D|nr:venom protease-like [Ischnura elegans]
MISRLTMEPTNKLLQIIILAVLFYGSHSQRPYRYSRQPYQSSHLIREEEPSPSVCTTPSDESGTCLVLRTCPPMVRLLRSGESAYLRRAICGYDGLEPKVCCPDPRVAASSTPGTTTTTSSTTTTTTTTPLPLIPNQGFEEENEIQCGFSNFTHFRVVGGADAQLGAWPWLAALAYRNLRDANAGPRFLCGGALISNRHILTAGHCVHRRKDLYFVRLGEHELGSDNDGASPIDVSIVGKTMHPNYNPTSYQNDIAILTLQYPVRSTMAIHPICLPDSQELRSKTFARNYPFVAGWGAVRFNGPSSPTLKELQLPVVEPSRCKDAYSNFKTTVIDDNVLCAGFARGGKDACQGDSGGPLMWPRGDQYYVIGVVSYGFRCAEPGYPGVYTRVTAFLDWIESVIRN